MVGHEAAATPAWAIVTGGTGGIGSAIARRLAQRGLSIAFTWRHNASVAQELAGELSATGVGCRHEAIDLEDAAAVAAFVAPIASGLTTVVHAAGPHVPMVHLSKVTPETFRANLLADALGFFTVMRAALPHLRSNAGSAVVVTTAATDRFPVRDGLSAGPKGSVDQLARAFAVEEGRYGVRVNIVGPGMLTDGMAERLISSGDLDERALAATRANIPLRRFGSAEDIAAAVDFLCGPGAAFISGQKLNVDGGYTA